MKKTVCGLLAAFLLLAACCCGVAESKGLGSQLLQTFFAQKDEPAVSDFAAYVLGADEIASIQAVVGARDATVLSQGDADQEYRYASVTVRDDLVAYIDYLGELGFEVVRGAPLGEPGEGELTAPSKEEGFTLSIRLSWSADSYLIRLTKSGSAPIVAQTQADADAIARGKAAIEAESFEEALEIFDAALAQQPDIAAYHGGRGEALVYLERYEEALESLNTAVRLDPAHWEYFCERGVAYYYLDRWDEALSDFEKSVELGPEESDAYFNLAYVQYATGFLEEAVITCALGITDFPEDADIWQLLGDVQSSLGHDKEALYAYDMAISIGYYTPENIEGYADVKQRATAPDDPVTPTPQPDGASRLMSYEEWLAPFLKDWNYLPGLFNRLLYSQDHGGVIEEVMEYPREWPAQWLGGIIPEYTGTGWMFDLYVAHPTMSYAAEDLLHVAVTVYDYLPEEVDAYIAGLSSYGFEEIQDSLYKADWIDSVRTFRSAECTLNLVFAYGEGATLNFYTLDTAPSDEPEEAKPFVQFNVDFDRAAYVPPTSPSVYTELVNIKEYDDLTGEYKGQPPELNQKTYEETDEYGRLYEVVYYPSQWPTHIFGDLIPEFTYPAVLISNETMTPADNPAPDQTLIDWLYLAGFYPEYVDAYARDLVAFGYREIPSSEFDQAEAETAAEVNVYRIFELPAMRIYLSVFVEDGFEELEICVRFDGRYDNFYAE